MRNLGIRLLLLAVALFAFGCGDSNSANINGNWVAVTSSNAGGQALTISFTMQEGTTTGNTTPVTFSNFAFSPANPGCFPTAANVNATGLITEPAQAGANRTMIVDLWSDPGATGNHDVLNVTFDPSNNSGTGSYSLTGVDPGCNPDNGTITFNRA